MVLYALQKPQNEYPRFDPRFTIEYFGYSYLPLRDEYKVRKLNMDLNRAYSTGHLGSSGAFFVGR
jgi:hypothetical protein